MKNTLVIDGAEHCAFPICLIDDDFAVVFPDPGQNVEFIEDLVRRVGEQRTGELVSRGATHRIRKEHAAGVHGTLFFGLSARQRYFPNKREDDIPHPPFVES
ncbi:MAG: hypothetical protein IT435_19655 [Phycisphaerales bacterium]|nr:hypothetical protein [Phycisphaerales bacterium]